MRHLVWLPALLLAAGCATLPPPRPVPPGPPVPLHLGLVGAYHGPLDDQTLRTLAGSSDLTLRAAVETLQQAQAIVASLTPYPTLKVLWLVEGANGELVADLLPILTAPAPNPTAGIELGNELDLAGLSPAQFRAWILASHSALRANGYTGRIVSGGIFTTQPEALRYLTNAGVSTWPADLVVGLHRYGDPDGPVNGYRTRDDETANILSVTAGHAIAFTEFGYPTRTPADEAWAAEAVTRDFEWFRKARAELATEYQYTDGIGTGDIDHYGIRTVDGRWKPVAASLGIPVPPPAPTTLAFDLVACATPFVDNYCGGPAGATFAIEVAANTWTTFAGDGNGYTFATGIPNVPDSHLIIKAPGYEDVSVHISPPTLVATNAKGIHNVWPIAPAHVDPSTFSLKQLAAIRGAMWPQTQGACGNLSIGPRPGQATNIFATVFLTEYPKAEADCMLQELHQVRGYTHAVAGPLVDSDGYHGVWTPNDWRTKWESFLDLLQQLWDAGLAPVVFLHPDGWTFEQTRDQFTPYLQQPRSQKLIRLAVGSGWEPAGYEWSSCTWTLYAQWVRAVLPNALSLIHNAVKPDGSPYDAFVGTDALCDDNGKDNSLAWRKIAPFLHGFLIQFDLFSGNTTPSSNPTLANNFAAQYLPDGIGAEAHGFRWHFVNGISGWPMFSAWGDNVPLFLYYGEGTAYGRFWQGMTEATGVAWGNHAMTVGHADGYLDSGSVAVPVKP